MNFNKNKEIKNGKQIIKIIGIIIFVIICFLIFVYNNLNHLQTEKGKKEKYFESAKLGGDYLVNHIDDNGKYVYEQNPIKREIFKRYNILRHAGTTYSLLELYEATGDKKFLISAEKAIDYLVRSIKPCPENINYNNANCLVEKGTVKLGGHGLAVLAMGKHEEATNSKKYLSFAQNLAEFITYVQSDDGEFTIHKMDVDNGNVYDFISMYYPGEAIFALSKLYQLDKNKKWIESAHRGAHWLISVRDKGKAINMLEHDHWLLYALKELYDHQEYSLYVEHAKKITDAILKIQHKKLTGEKENWNGGYYNPPRSTPTATRTEGLFSAYQIFQKAGEKEYAKKTLKAIENGIEFQLRTQMTKDKIKNLNADPMSLGGFHSSLEDYSIRIDYVQHNISAILGYLKIISN
jgi:uncharacterized protein YyaL (SSP411 family)